jgi:hypothetical protein
MRAHNPLHGTRADTKLPSNADDSFPGGAYRQYAVRGALRYRWPPQSLTLAPRTRQARFDAFLNHRSLEVGKHAAHLE